MNGAPNIGFIDLFTDTFSKYIDSGFGLLKGEVGYLASTLIVIDMTIAGLFWALAPDEDVLARLVKKTLYIGFFAFLIIGNVVASGVKVLVLAIVFGIGNTLFSTFTGMFTGSPLPTPTIDQAEAVALAALTLLGISIFAPGVATGLVSGAPQLGAGAAAGVVQ